MIHSIGHYVVRSRQLGLGGTLQHAWQGAMAASSCHMRSLWWDVMAHRDMTDSALLGHTTGDWPTVDKLLDHLADRPGSSFLLPHDSPENVARFLRQNCPERVSSVLDIADAACRGEFVLLGQVARYPSDIDWQRDPVTDWRWPLLYIDRLKDILWSPACPTDPKLVWELNRHQHFVALGMAYWLTGSSHYVDTFIAQIQSWMVSDLPQHGINWFSSLEVAVRLIAWTLAFQFFRGSAAFRTQAGGAFLKSLYRQAEFLANHLTVWEAVPNNHLIGETAALALVGAAFPEFRAAAQWREIGLHLLEEQVSAQTYDDGVNKEQATGYHRFVAEFLIAVVALGRRGLLPRISVLEDVLERMLDYVLYVLMPDRTVPMWGDADDGRALGLGQGKSFWDFRPLLSAGAVLFQRGDWRYAADQFDEEAFWLLGGYGLAVWERLAARPPDTTSRAFPDAGIYVMRDAWTVDADVAVFRCGPFGLGGEGQCAHAHCDLLSLQLWVAGRPLLVDSGTYIYWGPWRDVFRQTADHNTLMVDRHEQATPHNEFAWREVPGASCLVWEDKCVVGEMQPLPETWYQREIYHPETGIWRVIDHLEGDGVHDISWYFHFAPDLAVKWTKKSGCLLVRRDSRSFAVIRHPGEVQVQIKSGWHSPYYGHKQANTVIVATWHGEIPRTGTHFTWEFRFINETWGEQ